MMTYAIFRGDLPHDIRAYSNVIAGFSKSGKTVREVNKKFVGENF